MSGHFGDGTLGKDGYVWSFVNHSTTATKTLVMDIRTRVQSTENAGLTGLAFHPEFGLPSSAKAAYFYIMNYFTPAPLYLPAPDTDVDEGLDYHFYKPMQKFNERYFGGVFRIDVDCTPVAPALPQSHVSPSRF